ncbi:MAG: RIP metalloprotease RseP [Candidatus Levybacteria bacterium RIFCSPLOWO2_01_FULL_38_13]|nr:MAG: RIP metalloprotease RseP [Candidatus Levybacteria bacterium RIFCSPHIGHO2_01_FULL_41_15]OGH35073.1 MAG: RIP metalloprotease RseP [Candidatus Levybacteria bacterium RIFCSPLOWO2_01_FULL_38_13]
MVLTILVFLLILTVLVLIHEAGHFFVAKKLGIKVEEFGFGLPPRVFGIKKGETIYSINWLPIGGFVKLYGEDSAGSGKITNSKLQIPKKDESRAFFARPVWQRGLVVIAGVVMNFLLAVLIITYFFGVSGVQVPGDRVLVTDVVKDSPAHVGGLKKADQIVSVNDIKIKNSTQLVTITKQHLGEKVKLKIIREKEQKSIEIIPRKTYPSNEGPMGVSISSNVITQKYPLWEAPFVGLWEALKFSWLIVAGLAGVFYQILTSAQVPKGVAGPVGIAQLTGQFVAIGPLAVLSFVSLLSLNLAILNILPIPALDGGRLFFILIEAITGKKVSSKFESMAHAIGMAILLALIAFITLSDIIRLISGQPILPKP